MSQKQAFLTSEGDRYYERNLSHPDATSDPVLVTVDRLGLKPKSVLEIGCSDGWRVQHLACSKRAGIDPSAKAIASASNADIDLRVGTADQLPFADSSFDLVIFGFCLYLVDPALHFRCVAEADRVLSDRGSLLIYDFIPQKIYFNDYTHLPGLRSHKMQFANYFLANPAYALVYRQADFAKPIDERIGVDVLLKDQAGAFQKSPY